MAEPVPNQETLQEDLKNGPVNQDPEILTWALGTLVSTIQTWGWPLVFLACLLAYMATKLGPRVAAARETAAAAFSKKTDSSEVQARHEAMAAARAKMQARLDAQAALQMEKDKEKEEKRRLEKIENYQLQQQGKSKLKPAPSESAPKPGGASKKPALRPAYSPLMGDGGGASYRPARRGPSAGGG